MENVKIIVSKDNIGVENYNNIIYKEDIETILEEYRHKYNKNTFYNYIINKRSIKSMVYQWGAINLLHLLNIYNKDNNKDNNILYMTENAPIKTIIYYILGYIWFKYHDKYDLEHNDYI